MDKEQIMGVAMNKAVKRLDEHKEGEGIYDVILRNTYVDDDETMYVDEVRVEVIEDVEGNWHIESVDSMRSVYPIEPERR